MQCRNHIDREAVAMCISCRNFFCAECKTVIDGRNYCFPCSEKIAVVAVSSTAAAIEILSDPDPTPSPPPLTPPSSVQSATPISAGSPPVKKKSGCLKWAIIAIIIFVCLAIILAVAGILVYKKVIAPKLLPPTTEQQYAESTTGESGGLETGEQPAPVAEDTSIEAPSQPESESAPAENTESQPESDNATGNGSTEVNPQPQPENVPNTASPGMMNPMPPVPPVEASKLLSFLPKASFMWRAGTTNSGSFQKNNITFSSAQREYYFPPGNSKVTISIYDYGRNPQLYAKFKRPAVYTNADGYQKLVDIQGQRGIEKMDTKTKSGELSIEVKRRYVVEIQGENIPNSEVLKVFTQEIDLTQLGQLQ
jgi:hypothetical protein